MSNKGYYIKPFTAEERMYIKENYTGAKENVEELAKKMKRSVSCIRGFAFRNNLKCKKKRQPEKSITPISERENEVLNLLYKGKNPKEISEILCLSKNTVISHKNNILCKMEVNSVQQLLAKRIEELEKTINK